MKSYDKNKEFSYLEYWDVNNLYGWAMSLVLLLGGFKWVEETSPFSKDFIKSYNDDSDEGIKIEKVEKLKVNLHN